MKIKDLRLKISSALAECSFEEASFEADCMIADIIGVENSVLRVIGDNEVDALTVQKAESFVERRLSGEPLQYILGMWEFYGLKFFVGDGVLIPRPETELLIDTAIDFAEDKKHITCFDLCSGSGCIGISVSKLLPGSDVTVLEKSDKALAYLLKNKEYNNADNLTIVKGDLFDGADLFEGKNCDILLSNPPYIRSDVVGCLQREVLAEPRMALDGGDDGLDFYRAIAEKWFCAVKPDGMVAVEIGEEQGSDVALIFSRYFKDVCVIKDYSGNDRVVIAKERFWSSEKC
ncbi:MAG: peptide chain release factor N(5)-glutamine methyltransferase [Clostridia bacterium]|nr:peptide chain release factor N(5)-glutamine methyltransferase [Clostridia bacterium]